MNPRNQPDYQEFKNSEFHRKNYVEDVARWIDDLPGTWKHSHHEGKVWWLANNGHIGEYQRKWLLGEMTYLERREKEEKQSSAPSFRLTRLFWWIAAGWLLLQLFGNQ